MDINYKSEGFISNSEFNLPVGKKLEELFEIGSEIEAMIVKLETKEGYTLLSHQKAQQELIWHQLAESVNTQTIFEVKVISNVEGGLVVDYQNIRGFIPASHVLKNSNEKLIDFLEQNLKVIAMQVDIKRGKIIFSHKLAKHSSTEEELVQILNTLKEGEVKTGKVSSIKNFGIFVELGGIEGLVHISELSWTRVKHPSELVKIGDEVQVFILGIDQENYKISLGMKQLQPDPWVKVLEKYQIGQIVTGTISRIVDFGAFLQLEKVLEGLIHISELSDQHIEKVDKIVKPGMKVQAKIIKLMPDLQKLGLTLKNINQN